MANLNRTNPLLKRGSFPPMKLAWKWGNLTNYEKKNQIIRGKLWTEKISIFCITSCSSGSDTPPMYSISDCRSLQCYQVGTSEKSELTVETHLVRTFHVLAFIDDGEKLVFLSVEVIILNGCYNE